MVQAMEGAMDGTSYASGSSRTNVQAMDQGAVEGDIDGASDGRSNGWYKRLITKQSTEIWIRKLLKERYLVQAMEGAIDDTSDRSRSSRRIYGSGSCRRSGGWCER